MIPFYEMSSSINCFPHPKNDGLKWLCGRAIISLRRHEKDWTRRRCSPLCFGRLFCRKTIFTLRSGMMRKILEAWASTDPRGAADFALSQPRGNQQNGLLEAVMKKWFISDPEGAVSWIAAISEAQVRNRLLAHALSGYARSNPRGAASYVHLITSAKDRKAAYLNSK
jgi:hypothetical protein